MNNTPDTARYQLSIYIQSEQSQLLKLDAKDISILTVIYDFMDAGNNELCFAKQEKISKVSRVPLRTLVERINKLVELRLITKVRKQYLNHYGIGTVIKAHMQLLHVASATTALQICSDRTLYNNNYNNTYNNKQAVQPKQQKSKSKTKNEKPVAPLVCVEKQSTSYKPENMKIISKNPSPLLLEFMNKTAVG